VGTIVAWFAVAADDLRMLVGEFLPELLLASLLLLISWAVRRGFRRDARSTF
jgi:hypothetical protein